MLVDADDYSRFVYGHTWCVNSNGYAMRHAGRRGGKQRFILLHRQIMHARRGQVVDHVNGDRLDNRKANLRRCSPRSNCMNVRGRPGTSAFKGVSRRPSGRWGAKCGSIWLGTFRSQSAAARAYDAAALRIFGRYARLNFPKRVA